MGTGRWRTLIPALLWASGPTPLEAHVHIHPQTVEAGTGQIHFSIQPPLQKALPMVEFGIGMEEAWLEEGGSLDAFEEIPGWDIHVELDPEGRVTGVRWNGEEAAGEFRPVQRAAVGDTFRTVRLAMSVPDRAGDYAIRSWQKYSDGTVVHWNEEGGLAARSPYTTVTVAPAPLLAPGLVSWIALGLGLAALALALVGLRGSRRRTGSR